MRSFVFDSSFLRPSTQVVALRHVFKHEDEESCYQFHEVLDSFLSYGFPRLINIIVKLTFLALISWGYLVLFFAPIVYIRKPMVYTYSPLPPNCHSLSLGKCIRVQCGVLCRMCTLRLLLLLDIFKGTRMADRWNLNKD